MRSKHNRVAATISSSETVTTSSTKSRMMGQVRSPMRPRKPSATVKGFSHLTSSPAALEAATSAALFLPTCRLYNAVH